MPDLVQSNSIGGGKNEGRKGGSSQGIKKIIQQNLDNGAVKWVMQEKSLEKWAFYLMMIISTFLFEA